MKNDWEMVMKFRSFVKVLQYHHEIVLPPWRWFSKTNMKIDNDPSRKYTHSVSTTILDMSFDFDYPTFLLLIDFGLFAKTQYNLMFQDNQGEFIQLLQKSKHDLAIAIHKYMFLLLKALIYFLSSSCLKSATGVKHIRRDSNNCDCCVSLKSTGMKN